MRRTSTLALLAAATLALGAAACTAPSPTEARRPADAHRDDVPPDTSTTKCNGMIGSGTRC